MDDLIRQLQNLPQAAAAQTTGATTKRKPRMTKKTEAALEQRLLGLDMPPPYAAQSEAITPAALATLIKKGERLDQIKKLLAEQAKAKTLYDTLENRILALIQGRANGSDGGDFEPPARAK